MFTFITDFFKSFSITKYLDKNEEEILHSIPLPNRKSKIRIKMTYSGLLVNGGITTGFAKLIEGVNRKINNETPRR